MQLISKKKMDYYSSVYSLDEAGIFSTKENDQGEAEAMMSEYLHTVNFKVKPHEGYWLYISTNKVCLFSVLELEEWINRDEIRNQKYLLGY